MHSIDPTLPKKRRASSPLFLVGSVLLHLGLVLTLRFAPAPPPASRDKLEFTLADATPIPNAPRPAPLANRQIVEQDQRLNDQVAPDAKFLGAHDQKVERQTRAANTGQFRNKPSSPSSNAEKAVANEASKSSSDQVVKGSVAQTPPQKITAKNSAAIAKRARGELPALRDLIPRYDPGASQNLAATSAKSAAARSETVGSQTDDYLKDVEVGRQTLLTTREFVYFGYYARIKESLRQHWEPEVRDRVRIAYRRGRAIASARDHLTQVLVTLDARGELIKIDLLTQSGMIDLDGAAIEAFKRAAPFPNPPKGMVEADGTVRIRWDFVLES